MANTTLQPGFRFHPTDVELIMYYLKRKVLGKKLHLEVIREVNINKFTPWDLPDKSFIKSHDREWYFFCPIERKYAKGGRMNRTAEGGYWKTTGQDRTISYKDRIVGMLKTLIFHKGHPPKGERTDWVMHEYRMKDQQLVDAGVAQDAFVLCKLFHKDGPGPRNGAQYGAIFIEEEWDDPTPDPAETTQLLPSTSEQTNIGGSEVISTSFLAEPEAPDCGETLPSGIPMSVDTEENPPFVPEEVIGISLVEDVDFESIWASFTEDDLPTDLPNGYGNDAFSNLPDLYNWPEMQPYPDSYLEMNDLNNPLHLAEYTNMTEHMFSVNSDYVSVPSQSCYDDSTFVASQYASSSTETHFQAAGSDFNSNVSTNIHMPAGGPIVTGNPPIGGGLNQNSLVTPHIPLLAAGPNLTGNLSRAGGLNQNFSASTHIPLPAAGPNFAGGAD